MVLVAFITVVDVCFVNNIPLLLFNRGFSRQEIAMIMAVSTFGDFVSRIVQICFTKTFQVKNRYLVLFGISTISVLRFSKFDTI